MVITCLSCVFFFFFSSRRRHTRCALVTGVQTCALPISERLQARVEQKWSFIPPGTAAESYEILSWRIGAWLKSVGGPTVCVSHGGVIRSIFRLVGDMTEDDAALMTIPQDRILEVDLGAGALRWF